MYFDYRHRGTVTYPIDWDYTYGQTATCDYYMTPVSTWKTLPVIPKWWRWFDVFRTWVKPRLLRLIDGYRQAARRVQERWPMCQRRKQKRRAYVQRLHAL